MKVAILYGGKSGEHEVSLSSAAFIARNLDKAHRITLIGVSKDGQWVLQSQSTLEACLESDGPLTLRTDGPQVVIAPGKGIRVFGSHGVSDLNVDIVFPVLHGTFGEDGTVQGLLECANIAYVGADVLGSAVGMDKEAAKILWQASGLPVVPYLIARSSKTQELTKLRAEAEQRFGWPMFIKPARCGSSLGAQAVKAEADFIPAIEEAMHWDSKAIIEPFIHARELECSVIGNDEPTAFPPGEIATTHEFYSYDAKYIDPDGARLYIPAKLSPEMAARIQELSLSAYRTVGACGLARVDFFLDRSSNELYLSEINTMPGFTSISMFPMMCMHGGMPYTTLMETLLELGIERKKKAASLRFSKGSL